MLSQPFKYLVKEGERIVVISDSLVDYRNTSLMTSLWDMSALLRGDCFLLWDQLNYADQNTVLHRVDDAGMY